MLLGRCRIEVSFVDDLLITSFTMYVRVVAPIVCISQESLKFSPVDAPLLAHVSRLGKTRQAQASAQRESP